MIADLFLLYFIFYKINMILYVFAAGIIITLISLGLVIAWSVYYNANKDNEEKTTPNALLLVIFAVTFIVGVLTTLISWYKYAQANDTVKWGGNRHEWWFWK
jgi:ABC-type Fe3+-siderophore transport system permease subunit